MIKTLNPICNQVLLKNITWETYQTLLKDLECQPGTRMNYNAGLLEIMTPLNPHESYKQLVGRFVETLTEELNLEIRSLGSSTWCREDLAAGLEPDNCYYIQNEELVRYLEQIDLTQNPPPDLAIEIDITSSSLNRLEIYAALGVPEVWRYDGNEFKIYCLEGGKYQTRETSQTLPQLSVADIIRFLHLKKSMGETSLIRTFRQWVRKKIAEGDRPQN